LSWHVADSKLHAALGRLDDAGVWRGALGPLLPEEQPVNDASSQQALAMADDDVRLRFARA